MTYSPSSPVSTGKAAGLRQIRRQGRYGGALRRGVKAGVKAGRQGLRLAACASTEKSTPLIRMRASGVTSIW